MFTVRPKEDWCITASTLVSRVIWFTGAYACIYVDTYILYCRVSIVLILYIVLNLLLYIHVQYAVAVVAFCSGSVLLLLQ